MASEYIPTEDSLVRAVPYARLRKDEEGNVLGLEAAAFELRAGEEYLSAAWLEFFEGERGTKIDSMVRAFRKSAFPPTAKSGFALGQCGSISDACLARQHKVRVIHERTKDLEAHVAVRHWPADDSILFEEMARKSWAKLIMNRDVPAI